MGEIRFTMRTARVFRGYSQEQLAEKLGVHINTISNWEKDTSKVPMRFADKISKILDMPLDIFLTPNLQNVESRQKTD